jgi:hypothetical protein
MAEKRENSIHGAPLSAIGTESLDMSSKDRATR